MACYLSNTINPTNSLHEFGGVPRRVIIYHSMYKEETMVVSASNRNQLKQTISHNFDANVAFSEKKDDYKIILTTDISIFGSMVTLSHWSLNALSIS
jgi:hypothetical protein